MIELTTGFQSLPEIIHLAEDRHQITVAPLINVGDAESIYRRAAHNAREVGAPMVELRAAMRLSRLWSSQGKKEQARELLNEAYSKITEGFAAPDLKETRAILAALSS